MHSRCDVQSMLRPGGRKDNSVLGQHIMNCGGWENAMEVEEDDEFVVGDDETFDGEIWL